MAEGKDAVKGAASYMQRALAQQIEDNQKLRHGVSGLKVDSTLKGSFMQHMQQQLQEDDQGPLKIDGKWTPRMLAVLSGKPQNLMMHPDSHMQRIAQRAVKKFEKLRALAGDEVAMLVASQPEVVMLIERVEAKENNDDGAVPKYTIASCAQSAAAMLLELDEASAMSHLFAT